jgi:hypothetical protein
MIVPAVQPATRTFGSVPRVLIPSLSDCLFLAIVLWVFALGSGWSVLLADGDTGWHIRTGEHILHTWSVPVNDLFSFSKAGEPWFAWEWGSDILFAALHRAWGLKGVVVFSGLVLALSATLLFRHMVWREANLLAALLATLLGHRRFHGALPGAAAHFHLPGIDRVPLDPGARPKKARPGRLVARTHDRAVDQSTRRISCVDRLSGAGSRWMLL